MMALRYAAYTLYAILVFSFAYAAGTVCKYALEDAASPLPACQTEDSTNCKWDADTQGNGIGQSFIDIEGKQLFISGRRG